MTFAVTMKGYEEKVEQARSSARAQRHRCALAVGQGRAVGGSGLIETVNHFRLQELYARPCVGKGHTLFADNPVDFRHEGGSGFGGRHGGRITLEEFGKGHIGSGVKGRAVLVFGFAVNEFGEADHQRQALPLARYDPRKMAWRDAQQLRAPDQFQRFRFRLSLFAANHLCLI